MSKPAKEILSIPRGAKYPAIQSGESFDVYGQGYYDAAATLYKAYWGDGSNEPAFDWVVWPILSMLNHFVELELNEVVRLTYSIGSSLTKPVKDIPAQGTHDLKKLLEIADLNLEKLGLTDTHGDPLSNQSRNLIEDLQRFSPNGEGLRYPLKVEKQGGGPTLPESYVIDIPAVVYMVNDVWHEFAGVIGYLYDWEQKLFESQLDARP